MKNPANSDNVDDDLVKQVFKIINMGKELIELDKFNDGIDCYNKAIDILKQIPGYENEVQKTEKLIEEAHNKYNQIFPKSEQKSEEVDKAQLKKEKLAVFAKKKEEIEEKSKLAYDYLENGSNFSQFNQFDKALEKYMQAKNIFQEIGWTSEVPKVELLIKELNDRKNEFLKTQEKKIKIIEKKKKITEKEQEIISQHGEFLQKSEDIKETKLKMYQQKKQKEKDLSMEAYDLLGAASELIQSNEFEKALKNYNQAIQLFNEINWQSEIHKIQQFIKDLEEKQKRFMILQQEQLKKQEVSKEIFEKGQEFLLKQQELKKYVEDVKDTKIKAYQQKKQNEKDLSIEAYDLLGESSELEEENQFDEALENYLLATEIFKEIGWHSEVPKIQELIKKLKMKKNKYSKLLLKEKERQAQLQIQQNKLKEFELIKQESLQKASIQKEEKLKKLEQQKIERKRIEKEIQDKVNYVGKLERDYKKALKKGKFDQQNPYREIISTYEEIIEILNKTGWTDQINPYKKTIKHFEQKLARDLKLREIERQKKEEELISVSPVEDQIETQAVTDKRDKLELKKKKQKQIEKEIQDRINYAEQLEREYDLALRKKDFSQKAPYNEIILIYEDIIKILKEVEWMEQIKPYRGTIKYYEQELAHDLKLRELERQKQEKDEVIITPLADDAKSQEITDKRIELEQKKLKQQQIENEIQDRVNYAESLEREYELALKKKDFSLESPFDEIIIIYEELIGILKNAGWTDQIKPYSETIKHYEEKSVRDIRLRELERRKQEIDEVVITPLVDDAKSQEMLDKQMELETKKKKQERIEEEIQKKVNYAESLAREYELTLRKKDFSKVCPYENIIEIYEDIIEILKETGWTDQIKAYRETIKHYEQKLEHDKKFREFERQKFEKVEMEYFPPQESLKDSVAADLRMMKYEKKKKEELQVQKEIDEMINVAENMAREYEKNLKYKDFSKPCPYEEVIKIYRKAKNKLQSVDWNEQAESLIATITHYKNKLVKDIKFRELEKIKEFEKEKEKLEIQKLTDEQKALKDRELDLKRKKLYEAEEREKLIEQLQEKAFQLMDQAKSKLRNKKFDESIELYDESKKIFEEINYKEGIILITNTILSLKKERETFSQRFEKAKEIEAAKLVEEREMEQKFRHILEKEREKRKERLSELAVKKKEEKRKGENAFRLIDKASNFILKEKFDKAYEQYTEARQIFGELGWKQEVTKIDQDHLFYLKKKMREVEERKERLKHISREKKKMEELMSESERIQSELEKSSAAKLRSKYLKKEKEKIKLKSKEAESYQALDEANELINSKKFNSAVRLLRKVYSEFINSGWKKEAQKIKLKIDGITNQSLIPIIQEEKIEKKEYFKEIDRAYNLLDEAERASLRAKYMRVVSVLVEVKEIFEEIQWANALKIIIEQIDINKINVKEKRIKREIEETGDVIGRKVDSEAAFSYMNKCKMAERRNNLSRAIQFAEKAHHIFKELGKDWEREANRVEQYIDQLKTAQKERKTKIERVKTEKTKKLEAEKMKEQDIKQRLEERRKRREDLRKRLQERKNKKE